VTTPPPLSDKPPERDRAGFVAGMLTLCFVSVLPILALLEFIFSEGVFDRYGLIVPFFFCPTLLVASALVLTIISFRYVFSFGSGSIRIFSSLLFSIVTVALSVGVFLGLHSMFPRSGRWL
jgi:hypothetical protein